MNRKKKDISKFADILKKYKYSLNDGDIVAGTIIHRENTGFLVNIGTNTSGYLPKEEIGLASKKDYSKSLLLIGITRDFFLITQNNYNKQYIISVKRLDYMRAWKRLKQLYLEDIVFNLKIKYTNKGGIITYLEGIQGFIPKSHIHLVEQDKYKQKRNELNIQCKLLTINDQKNQLILSNKSALFILSGHKFKLGELVYGKIISTKSYGLFLEIYGIKALLHISEIGSKYIANTKLFFKKNALIKVKIIHISVNQGRLSVSKRNIKNEF